MSDARGTPPLQTGATGPTGKEALTPAPAPSVGDSKNGPQTLSHAGVADAAAVVDRKKRGRPPGSSTARPQTGPEELARLQQQAAMIDQLFTPENFRALVELPGNVGYALTGHEFWNLSEAESKTLASTGAAVAKVFNVSPQWLAVFLLLSSMASIYGSRMVKEVAIRRTEKKRNAPPAKMPDEK